MPTLFEDFLNTDLMPRTCSTWNHEGVLPCEHQREDGILTITMPKMAKEEKKFSKAIEVC